ncbi:efflux transporter periplasmic adaptor subunit [Bacterioplanes sanyensis]|uniref:Efflux transporter periplasmic adaptor subunit n=1 Tax=Bacterioplanes sanyensis TaxID=1249553 RepID=A0A222FHG6_9GAMM|nr:efflux RND transporter periplasmic adaptor subunit [Bacterioplanes sanyensis]ASP38209.1 efflux transporter periplasmic adaptor subunit [Bacterioplanes sanyensis]
MTSVTSWRPLALALLALVVTITLVAVQLSVAKPSTAAPAQAATMPQVDVIYAEAQAHTLVVSGYGSAQGRYQQPLTAAVDGQVVAVSSQFEAGQPVAAGTPLLTLQSQSYQAALATAQRELADAKVAYLEEQRASQQAQQEWQASNMGEPESELVLRQPQLQAAQARWQQAKQQVELAWQQLRDTELRAPFDAVVMQRTVAPGEYLARGNVAGELVSSDMLYIRVPLSLSQWQQLPSREQLLTSHWQAWVEDIETGQRWSAYISQVDQHVDAEQRQRSLTLAVAAPLEQQPPLYPGTFVKAALQANVQDSVWQLPASVLSAAGQIWYVDEQQQLASFTADVVARDQQALYVRPPADLVAQRVAVVRSP